MKIEVRQKKKIVQEVATEYELTRYWVVRIIEERNKVKNCIAEYGYMFEPTERHIADCLSNHLNKNVFASIVENYRLKEVE